MPLNAEQKRRIPPVRRDVLYEALHKVIHELNYEEAEMRAGQPILNEEKLSSLLLELGGVVYFHRHYGTGEDFPQALEQVLEKHGL